MILSKDMTDNSSNKNVIRVLLADDHQMILDGLAALIDAESAAMTVAGRTSDPEKILELVCRLDPDVVLLDLDLGKNRHGEKVCGLDLLPQIVSRSRARVLILTGEQDVALHAEAIGRGAKGVVVKNAPGAVIVQAIRKAAAGQRWHTDELLEYIMNRHSGGGGGAAAAAEEASDSGDAAARRNIASLTATQRRVIATIAANVTSTNSRIAGLLRISEHTLKNHLTEINSKLCTKNKMDLFMFAKKHNLDKNGS